MSCEQKGEWWRLQESSFHSRVPILGAFIVAFRNLWNNVATRWYVIPLIQQQNQINRRLLEELHLLREDLNIAFEGLSELDKDFVDAHRTQVGGIYRLQRDVDQLSDKIEKLLEPEDKR
jgi:hypothetical protein